MSKGHALVVMVNRHASFTAIVFSCIISIVLLSRLLLGSAWLDSFHNASSITESNNDHKPNIVIIYASNGPGKFVQVADFEDKMLRNRYVYARKHGKTFILAILSDSRLSSHQSRYD